MKEHRGHRRHAVQIVSVLPGETEDALIVLRLAMDLVKGFLAQPEPTQKPATIVVRIGGNECA
jgi:hypothetical protein